MALQKTLILVVAFSLLTGCTQSDVTTPSVTATQVVSLNQEFDLGKMGLDSHPEHTFEIRNTTDAAFTVTSVQTSCSCQSANLEVGTVVPAGEAVKVVFLLSEFRSGKQTGQMVISTDSPVHQSSQIRLTLHVELPRRIWTEPASILLTANDTSSSSSQQVRVMSELPGLLETFQEVTSSRELVVAKLIKKTPTFLLFNFTLSKGALVDGDAFDYVILRFKDIRMPEHTLRVRSQSKVLETQLENSINSSTVTVR